MEYTEEFRNLAECVAYLRERYPDERLSESRDIDTGKSFRGARFPRWLFRGERSCYPASRPTLWRLRRSGDHFADAQGPGARRGHTHRAPRASTTPPTLARNRAGQPPARRDAVLATAL